MQSQRRLRSQVRPPPSRTRISKGEDHSRAPPSVAAQQQSPRGRAPQIPRSQMRHHQPTNPYRSRNGGRGRPRPAAVPRISQFSVALKRLIPIRFCRIFTQAVSDPSPRPRDPQAEGRPPAGRAAAIQDVGHRPGSANDPIIQNTDLQFAALRVWANRFSTNDVRLRQKRIYRDTS